MRSLMWLAFYCFSVAVTFGQVTVKGVVVDDSQKPIIGASVFLNNTSYSTPTDSAGAFSLEGKNGNHQLIAYKEGFLLNFVEINRSAKLRITLKRDLEAEQASDTSTQNANFSDILSEELLTTFKLDFLGRSKNAENCEILNPEVIKFELKPESGLKASTSGPILIRNKRLGYDLSYYLESYERNSKISSYVGYVSFQNTPGLELKPKHFEAREKAYRGSTAHFLKSVLAGKHNREGYRLQTATQVGEGWIYKEVPISDLAVYNEKGVFLFGAGKFRIVYLAERREYNYVRWLKASAIKDVGRGQYTEMEFATQKVRILPNGTLDPPLGLVFRGYMGWEHMGDALPVNYQL